MTAKKKGIVSLIVGAVLGVIFAIVELYSLGDAVSAGQMTWSELIVQAVVMVPCFMLYAFGYAFGWKKCKGFVASMAKVGADVAFFYIIVQLITGKGLGKGLIIAILIFSFSIGIIWIPGIVIGIKQILSERKLNVAV